MKGVLALSQSLSLSLINNNDSNNNNSNINKNTKKDKTNNSILTIDHIRSSYNGNIQWETKVNILFYELKEIRIEKHKRNFKVLSIVCADETGNITVKFDEERCDELKGYINIGSEYVLIYKSQHIKHVMNRRFNYTMNRLYLYNPILLQVVNDKINY